MTQCDRVIQYIRDFGSISTREAMLDIGCMRLASRICDLKDKGYDFNDKWEYGKNRYGKKVKWKRYWFRQDG